jgi:hypothetical protein
MTESGSTARATLRGDILAMGRDDFVSMADLQGQISRGRLADSDAERQQLVMDTIQPLLQDGLIEIGDIPGRADPGFKPWPGPADEVMSRFTDCFIGHYEDRREWEYTIWFNLTAKGQEISGDFVDD